MKKFHGNIISLLIYNIESPSKMSITALIVGSVWNDQAAHYTEAEMKLANGPSIVASDHL